MFRTPSHTKIFVPGPLRNVYFNIVESEMYAALLPLAPNMERNKELFK